MRKHIVIIYGPTGVGKSDYALALGEDFPIEIVNCDVGQFYTPFSIGTAKPDWKHEKVPHHLFDSIDTPEDFTVVQYRKKVLELCQDIWQRGATPVLVGGSGFYIKSLFFPPILNQNLLDKKSTVSYENQTTEDLFTQLTTIDPVRAAQLHPHDRYRIERALTLAQAAPGAVHTLDPVYQDLGFPFLLLCLTRERSQLYARINERTEKMIQAGWVAEVAALQTTPWAAFLKRKKLIGYNDILSVLEDAQTTENLHDIIALKTRHYAKRQMTFWRMLQKQLAGRSNPPSKIEQIMITDEQATYMVCKEYMSEFLRSL